MYYCLWLLLCRCSTFRFGWFCLKCFCIRSFNFGNRLKSKTYENYLDKRSHTHIDWANGQCDENHLLLWADVVLVCFFFCSLHLVGCAFVRYATASVDLDMCLYLVMHMWDDNKYEGIRLQIFVQSSFVWRCRGANAKKQTSNDKWLREKDSVFFIWSLFD